MGKHTAEKTPDQLRDEATRHDMDAHESFERSDTDGFMSQWASSVTAAQKRLEAEIIENGGKAMFPALFDLDGNLVPAKLVYIQRFKNSAWGLLPDADPRGRFVGWFNPSRASKPGRARHSDAFKNFYVGYVMAPATAELRGGNVATVTAVAVRTDGGFSPDAEIVDNGHGDTDVHRWYDIQDGTI